jgi:hypothetical protein
MTDRKILNNVAKMTQIPMMMTGLFLLLSLDSRRPFHW